MQKSRPRLREYKVGDEISYALASGIRYGTVVRLLGDVVEIEFEDGKKETKKAGDGRLRLIRRQESPDEHERTVREDIRELRRSEIRRR